MCTCRTPESEPAHPIGHFLLCVVVQIFPEQLTFFKKWSQLTPWKYAHATPTHSAPAIRCVHNFCLAKQMPMSLNIFICIHVSISKGVEVNPPPRGREMSQCFSAAASVGVVQKHQDRLTGDLCRQEHRDGSGAFLCVFLFNALLSVKYKSAKSPKKLLREQLTTM